MLAREGFKNPSHEIRPLMGYHQPESQKPRQRVSNADRKVFANPESFRDKGHYWLKNFRILCNTKYPDNMQSVRMNCEVSGQSK